MSHEIRTPLNAVIGFAQLLRHSAPLTDTQRAHIETILRSGDHLLAIVNQLLEISKIEAGAVTLANEYFDLAAFCEDIKAMFSVRAIEKNLDWQVRLDEQAPRFINADVGKVRQVLINLLGNAFKFTTQGSVSLSVRNTGPTFYGNDYFIEVTVKDSGPGMTPEELAAIFDPFVQGPAGKTYGGTGLGLMISKRYATLMEGTLTATSAPRAGSTFVFTFRALPASKPERFQKPTVSMTMKHLPPGVTYKVLIVDDDASSRDILRLLLTEKGFVTAEARDGREALAVFWQWQPELVVMDIKMPEMDGIAAIREMRKTEAGKRIPIIVLSALAMEEDKNAALAAGADAFLKKPLHEEDLCTEVTRLLAITCRPQDETSDTVVSGSAASPTGGKHDLSSLTADQQATVRSAALIGDTEALEQAATEIEKTSAANAARIRQLTHAFDYERIIHEMEGTNGKAS